MGIREVISYDKDYRTGKVYKEKKEKEDGYMKGKVTIELFDDETGEKVKEAYTENIIPDTIFKDIYLRYFSGEVLGIGDTNHNHTRDLFNFIYLTDALKPESAASERVSGNIIGYAHRGQTYSGSDTQRGTINLAETRMEVRNNKVRVNFVFDFPTHAANGTFESIFWSDDISQLDRCYEGPPVCLRSKTSNTGRGRLFMSSSPPNDEIKAARWGYLYLMGGSASRFTVFKDYHSGHIYFDGTNSSAINSTLIQFPEHLKEHQLILPFDLTSLSTGFVEWSDAITLLNDSGEAFHRGQLSGAFPVLNQSGDIDYIFGYYNNRVSSSRRDLTFYKWSRVGVLQDTIALEEIEDLFKDEYGTNFNYVDIATTPVLWGDPLEVYGYHQRSDPSTNETTYSNRVIRLNENGTLHSELRLRPRVSSSTWFEAQGMHSGNIERRCRLSSLTTRTRNRIYLFYTGLSGGSSFYQVISPEGNMLEPYRSQGVDSDFHNVRGTDKWLYVSKSSSNSNYTMGVYYGATSRPCGAHTKLAQPVEKTDANTMKVQYMFEIDLIDYLNDLY